LIIICCIVLKIQPGIKNDLAVYPGMVQQDFDPEVIDTFWLSSAETSKPIK
jgi:hypothetical protein